MTDMGWVGFRVLGFKESKDTALSFGLQGYLLLFTR